MYPNHLKLRSILPFLLMSLFLGGSTYPHFPDSEMAGGIEFKMETTDSRMTAMVRSMSFNKENKQIDIETVKTIRSV